MISSFSLSLATGDWRRGRKGVWCIHFPTCLHSMAASLCRQQLSIQLSTPGWSHCSLFCPHSPKSGNLPLMFLKLGLAPSIVGLAKACSYFCGNHSSVTRVGATCLLFGGSPYPSSDFPSNTSQQLYFYLQNVHFDDISNKSPCLSLC